GVRTLARRAGARCFGPVHDRNHPRHGDRRMPAVGWRPGPACLRGAANRVVASGHRGHDRRRFLARRRGRGREAGAHRREAGGAVTGAAPAAARRCLWPSLAAYTAISAAAGFLFIKSPLRKIPSRLYIRQYWRDHPYGPLTDREVTR